VSRTWYGTHSRKGALTTAILFSLVESCKLNKINPRNYFKELVESIHQGKGAFTPGERVEMSLNVWQVDDLRLMGTMAMLKCARRTI